MPDKVALLTGKPSAPAQEKTRVGERSRYCQHFAGRSGYREPVGDSRHTRDEPQASGCRSLEPTNGYGRQNCLRDVVEGSVRPLGPPPHDYDNTGRASTRRLRTRRSIRQRSLLFLFLLLRHPVADAGIGEDVGAVVLVAAEAARRRCASSIHPQPHESYMSCSALTNARAFFTDHCSRSDPKRGTSAFWDWKSLSLAVFSQVRMPTYVGASFGAKRSLGML